MCIHMYKIGIFRISNANERCEWEGASDRHRLLPCAFSKPTPSPRTFSLNVAMPKRHIRERHFQSHRSWAASGQLILRICGLRFNLGNDFYITSHFSWPCDVLKQTQICWLLFVEGMALSLLTGISSPLAGSYFSLHLCRCGLVLMKGGLGLPLDFTADAILLLMRNWWVCF